MVINQAGVQPNTASDRADRGRSEASDRDDERMGPQYTGHTRDVYGWCMAKVRTNIEVEDDDVRAIMDRYGVHTKTEAVNLALRYLAGQPMSREEAMGMRGAHAIDEVGSEDSPRGDW